ncbi:uncharacterized protein LOC128740052 [Sabethes cyaneus]|uniref:uncharacterized protein LOC128740052 n=1 Tax=Sabethes cyaneus TaxID=53552 RepID=UPI00237E975A|nr:uncharacterized protein LOC128740052 [Sabethes cyaneus]
MEVIQINLNRCDTAQQLLWQSTTETKCDVAIKAEPYRISSDNGNWIADRAGMAAILVTGRYPIQEVVTNRYEGFVVAKINGVFVCSCYAPPRWTLEQFCRMLDELTGELIGRRPIVIGGDFNAWATEWGSRCTNARGASLLEALATLEVELSNVGTTSTFRRDGRESIIDVTFCSPSLRTDINWRVCEEFTYSDHQAIRYTVGQRNPVAAQTGRIRERQWKMEAFDKDLFVEALRPHSEAQNGDADELTEALTRACDTTMPRKVEPRNRRRPVYWWNESLNALRANCNRARRCFQRARSTETREERRSDLRVAKAALKYANKQSKTNAFKELCRAVDSNPWGDAYRIVMARIRGPAMPAEGCPDKTNS